MLDWREYEGHKVKIVGKRKPIDNTIFTFDIETSSFLKLGDKIIPAIEYLNLSKQEQEQAEFYSCMFIWQFSIDDKVYYGRTWKEFYNFLYRIEYFSGKYKRYIFVHNLSFEFQFLRNCLEFTNVFSRKSRKVMRFELADFNMEFRCSYMLSNCALDNLSKIYKLNTKKLIGNLDYTLIRHSQTKLTDKELEYCENDCLVLYEYIKKELETYKTMKKIPLTSTGKLRKKFIEKINENFKYKNFKYINKVKKSINVNPHIYNLLLECFAGGYTHANWLFSDTVIKGNIKSFDFCSSYPYVMTTSKFPMTTFKKCNITNISQVLSFFAYIIKVRFYNIQCNYYNNFISLSKVNEIENGRYDNGRIISADYIEMTLTDVDLKFIFSTHTIERYEFVEVYYSRYDYLPKEFINFVLDCYENKTKYKNVEGEEVRYNIEKQFVNSMYGMCVTNNIRDNVIFDNRTGWSEEKISNEEIVSKLEKEKEKGFLSFSWGVWITSIARCNLLYNVVQLDKNTLYCDTDSIKVFGDYDTKVIDNYNKSVFKRIENVSKELEIDKNKFMPKDKKGISHPLGVFENDNNYDEFITQGAKKYAYVDSSDKQIHITVAGVPKKGAKALKSLEDFRDNFIFDYEYTGKNLIVYNDYMQDITITDYQGNVFLSHERYGSTFIPTTYELGKSQEYCELLSDESSARAIYEEV